MKTVILLAAVGGLAVLWMLWAIWSAPVGEEDEQGFHALGPSQYERFRARLARRRRDRLARRDLGHSS